MDAKRRALSGSLAAAALASASFLAFPQAAFADAQERLMKDAARQLIALNDEMLKGLELNPKELDGKKVYVKARVLERPDGASELKVEELTLGEPKREPQADGATTLYLKGTVKPQQDRTWKLSIDDVLPKEPGKADAGANDNASKGDKEK